MTFRLSRRELLTATGGVLLPYWWTSSSAKAQSANDRVTFGAIGTGQRFGVVKTQKLRGVGGNAAKYGDFVMVCDADSQRREQAKALLGGKAAMVEDYRKVLERDDIQAVTIVTPDHWHTKIALDAMDAGKDVYCEKPLTLTIEEGKLIRQKVADTGRVFQVGTQQRSEMGLRFLQTVALARSGRLGEIKKVTCAIGGSPESGPLQTAEVPKHLNWDLWQGQAPAKDYIPRRCHYEFRWWYEYSGGKLTDWGAHHVDIAQWAIGMDHGGPTLVEPLEVEHPVPLKKGMPTRANEYNCATKFKIRCTFPNGVEMLIRNDAKDLGFDNGICWREPKAGSSSIAAS